MGTSSLYKGPKKTSLLPSDYNPDEDAEQGTSSEDGSNNTSNEDANDEESKSDNQSSEKSQEQQSEQANHTSENWGSARRSMRKAMNDRSTSNVKSAIGIIPKLLVGIQMQHDKRQEFVRPQGYSIHISQVHLKRFVND